LAPSAVGGLSVSDIGGHHLADGRWFRTGLVFRISGGMVGGAELAHLDTLGLRVLVDLRGADEDRRALEDWAARRDALYALQPISLGNPATLAASMAEAGRSEAEGRAYLQRIYRRILDDFSASMVGAVTAIAARQPAGFGCAAGKDRTGLLSAMIQEVLGVDRAAIVAGYVSQAPDPDRLREAVGTWQQWDQADLSGPGVVAMLAAVEEVMTDALDYLGERYGGANRYLEAAGLPAETVARLRDCLVADRPG
jgi:protein-tyrosine phosphatase